MVLKLEEEPSTTCAILMILLDSQKCKGSVNPSNKSQRAKWKNGLKLNIKEPN